VLDWASDAGKEEVTGLKSQLLGAGVRQDFRLIHARQSVGAFGRIGESVGETMLTQ
jgi:hypothetical protein